MFRFIIKHRYSYIVSLTSITYGIQLLLHPDIFNNYSLYEVMNGLFNYKIISILFIMVGLINMIGLSFKIRQLKRISLSSMFMLWFMFGLSFVFTDLPNTVHITSMAIAAIVFGIALEGDKK